MLFEAILRIETEAKDGADATETVSAILDGGLGMATAYVRERRIIRPRRRLGGIKAGK